MRKACFTTLALSITALLAASPLAADPPRAAKPRLIQIQPVKAQGQIDKKLPGPARILFAREGWYVNQKGKAQSFDGVVVKQPGGGGIGFGRFNPFTLKMKTGTREIYIGGRRKILDPYVGKRVRIVGKPVTMEVVGKIHNEIWPASIALLDGGKIDLGDAAKGRPVKIQATARIVNYKGPRGYDFDSKPTALALRVPKAYDKMLSRQSGEILRQFKVKEIDFNNQMVLWVQAGVKRTGGYRVTIDRVILNEADEKMTVYWTLHPHFGGAVIQVINNPGGAALVEKYNGRIEFVQQAPPRIKPGDKLPPSAPPPGLPGRPGPPIKLQPVPRAKK